MCLRWPERAWMRSSGTGTPLQCSRRRFSVAIRISAASRSTSHARMLSASLTRHPVSARVRHSVCTTGFGVGADCGEETGALVGGQIFPTPGVDQAGVCAGCHAPIAVRSRPRRSSSTTMPARSSSSARGSNVASRSGSASRASAMRASWSLRPSSRASHSGRSSRARWCSSAAVRRRAVPSPNRGARGLPMPARNPLAHGADSTPAGAWCYLGSSPVGGEILR